MPLEDEDYLDEFYDDEPLRYRTVTPLGQAPRLFTQLHLTHADEPTTYVEGQGDPAWRAAMEQELESVEKNKT